MGSPPSQDCDGCGRHFPRSRTPRCVKCQRLDGIKKLHQQAGGNQPLQDRLDSQDLMVR